jgi:hypothetical protein
VADTYRRHALINAQVDEVWEVVSDPRTHPDWWPDVKHVHLDGELEEGGEFVRGSRRLGFLDVVDAVWVAERLDELKEAHFRCTLTGTYTKFSLTPAADDTFVEIEAGMLPPNRRWKALKPASKLFFRGWLRDLLDALPAAIARRKSANPTPPPA